jgi:putative hemolysin
MMLLWQFLARYIKEQGIEILFGVASFQNSDPRVHALPLAYLQAHYLADDDIRPSALVQEPINYATQAELQAKQALQQMPALIKAYLRLGGKVGEGIYVDHAFNTTDVCMVLKTEDLLTRSKLFYPEGAPFD